LAYHGDIVQLVPYNTGSMHVPNAPRRGTDVFVNVDRYAHDQWQAKRGRGADAVVELTVKYQIKDIGDLTRRVERWVGGTPSTFSTTLTSDLARMAASRARPGRGSPRTRIGTIESSAQHEVPGRMGEDGR
jgi:hypothetical protein